MNYLIGDEGHVPAILELLGRCFPEHWRKHAERGVFPHYEVAVLAEEDGVFCGHVGILPFRICDAGGRIVDAGGIASVAVDPAFRGRGIASGLCRLALDYGRRHGYELMPLYTSLFRVYEVVGWQRQERPPQLTAIRAAAPLAAAAGLTAKPVAELSETERGNVMALYAHSRNFPGKVIRSEEPKYSHSWRRFFVSRRTILLQDDGYALLEDGALVECVVSPEAAAGTAAGLLAAALAAAGGRLTLCLEPGNPALAAADVFVPDEGATPVDPFHGEEFMYAFCGEPEPVLAEALRTGAFHYGVPDKF